MTETFFALFGFTLLFEPPAVAGVIGTALTLTLRRRLGRAFWPALLGFLVLVARKMVEVYVDVAELRDDWIRLEFALDAAWSALLTAAFFIAATHRRAATAPPDPTT
ncbi:hypothetical protein ACQEVZ_50735 [Dactylosporangium sp. CA-152071]|uniref:hypothetical protein n=1 Tax=Dactylosporangium sp. CA-152071 TaxID=3239933 RepID=UPI003D947069